MYESYMGSSEADNRPLHERYRWTLKPGGETMRKGFLLSELRPLRPRDFDVREVTQLHVMLCVRRGIDVRLPDRR